jgi:hypothetical protein
MSGIDSYTKLLLHFDEGNGATTFPDSSGNSVSITRYGNTVQSTTQYKWISSAYFDGSGDYLRHTYTGFALGTSSFTVDAWVYLNAMPTSDSWPSEWASHVVLWGVGTFNQADGCNMIIGKTKLIIQSNDGQVISATHGMSTGQWYHLAYVRDGTSFLLFVNGTQIGTTVTSSASMGTGAYSFIGCETGQGAYLNGYMEELRVSIGIARWTSNFTPPTGEYTSSSGPSVTTSAATSITPTTATLNGEVTAINDSSITDRGFVWDTSTHSDPGNTAPASSGYSNNWAESGTYSTGTFNHGITGLSEGETYYFRACAKNDTGAWSYGSELSLTASSYNYYYGSDLTFNTTKAHKIEMAFGSPLFSDPTAVSWDDVTAKVKDVDIKIGRMHDLDRVEAGEAILVIDNENGNWWRNNDSGAYTPNVKPLTLCRITGEYNGDHPIFYGYIEKISPDWDMDGGYSSFVEIPLVDFFEAFARYTFTITEIRSAELSGARMEWLLDQIAIEAGLGAWPANLKDFTNGTGTVTVAALPAGDYNALDELQKTAKAEGGVLFVAGDGKVTLHDAMARNTVTAFSTAQSTYSDSGADSSYVKPKLVDDYQYIYNIAHIKRMNGGDIVINQTCRDATAVSQQGPRVWEETDSIIDKASDAYIRAFVLVNRYNDSKLRCPSLLIDPEINPADLYPKIFGHGISTRVRLELDSTRNPAKLFQDYHIEGKHLHFDAMKDSWTCEFQLWDVNPYRTFNPGHTGYLEGWSDISYANCHDSVNAHEIKNDSGLIIVGQAKSSAISDQWWIWRGSTMLFDTSTISVSKNIIAATLLLYLKPGYTVTEAFDLCAVGDPPVHQPLINTDFGALEPEETTLGQYSIPSGAIPEGWKALELNSDGLDAINKGGATTFNLRSSDDISATAPAGYGQSTIGIDTSSDYLPILVVVTD